VFKLVIKVEITKEMIEKAKRLVMQGATILKPEYTKKTTEELLRIFEQQAHLHSYGSVSGRDDVEFETIRQILVERGKTEYINGILDEAENARKKAKQMGLRKYQIDTPRRPHKFISVKTGKAWRKPRRKKRR